MGGLRRLIKPPMALRKKATDESKARDGSQVIIAAGIPKLRFPI